MGLPAHINLRTKRTLFCSDGVAEPWSVLAWELGEEQHRSPEHVPGTQLGGVPATGVAGRQETHCLT